MAGDLLEAARAEQVRLLQELRKTAIFRQYEAVCSVVAVYNESAGRTIDSVKRSGSSAEAAIPWPSNREGSKASIIARAAEEFLKEVQRRAQSPEIMRAITERGITLSGDNPLPALSSILSHNSLFDNVRGQGYGLVEWRLANKEMLPGMSPQQMRDAGIIPTHAVVVGENQTLPIPPGDAAVLAENALAKMEDAE